MPPGQGHPKILFLNILSVHAQGKGCSLVSQHLLKMCEVLSSILVEKTDVYTQDITLAEIAERFLVKWHFLRL